MEDRTITSNIVDLIVHRGQGSGSIFHVSQDMSTLDKRIHIIF
ncbi:hypothetical protein J2T12_002045 [Paenibacillus anaericanus]|nr:hypothetical protein [Paenibacillus anaericanus]